MFQRGASALQRHAYADAAGAFRALLSGFPTERAVLDRARVYLELCKRELERRPAAPRTNEERITAATAALNNGDADEAEHLAKTVLGNNSRHELAWYLMAVVHARRGQAEAALDALSRAVAASPEVKAQAKYDADFDGLRDLVAFRTLTETLNQPIAATRRIKRK